MLITIEEATELLGLNARQVSDIENLVSEEARDYVMPFGKWKGKKLYEVPEDYVSWMTSSDYFKALPTLSALSKHMTNYFFPTVVTTSTLKQWFHDKESTITQLEMVRFPGSETLMPFGKYKNMTIMQVVDYDGQYLKWLSSQEDSKLDAVTVQLIKTLV